MTNWVWDNWTPVPDIIIEVLSSTGEARVRPGDWLIVLIGVALIIVSGLIVLRAV